MFKQNHLTDNCAIKANILLIIVLEEIKVKVSTIMILFADTTKDSQMPTPAVPP